MLAADIPAELMDEQYETSSPDTAIATCHPHSTGQAIAIALLIVIMIASPGQAQLQTRQDLNPEIQLVRSLPISRERFQQIHQMGGGVDHQGQYRHPIPVEQVYGWRLPDGDYLYPMAWDLSNSIIFEVRNGYIVRLNYRFNR